MPQYQDLYVLGGVAAGEQRHPAEQPDHEQVEEANEHDRRGKKPRSGALHEFWHATGATAQLCRIGAALAAG